MARSNKAEGGVHIGWVLGGGGVFVTVSALLILALSPENESLIKELEMRDTILNDSEDLPLVVEAEDPDFQGKDATTPTGRTAIRAMLAEDFTQCESDLVSANEVCEKNDNGFLDLTNSYEFQRLNEIPGELEKIKNDIESCLTELANCKSPEEERQLLIKLNALETAYEKLIEEQEEVKKLFDSNAEIVANEGRILDLRKPDEEVRTS